MDGTAGKPQGGQNIAGERAPEPTAESRCADTDTVRPPAPSTLPPKQNILNVDTHMVEWST